ncbi:carbohydrate-binding module family 18 protein [Didymella exigua CBS 183.55]|uniref:chitinase n=1 Tax=Didymella exigua CBS 183.55 TaxID=1150837 RepID=A0A6A5RDT1_9PLEO|nr:carbohydrate-binding module family 18 protein [Didymella exigua CBS 183.55]KAF1925832.1 carbohydrate-binding module family 18 protein [Didymella exigua CBS 183.55]
MRFTASWALPALLSSTSARFVMYADEWHPTRPTNAQDRAGIDHVVLAFANANNTAGYSPKVPISTIRSEFPNAKVMIAVGGWGDDTGFQTVSSSDSSIQRFANDVNTMLTNTGADGVDIDWEYPGGNGADYKQVSNSAKSYQMEAYPKLLAATRTAIGPHKLLSIAVPGKKGDMIAYTSEIGSQIWPLVDYINVMSYDLMNRRDNVTQHHTSVAGSEETIKNYLDIGAPAPKINLGFAYYAKYFTTAGDCSASPLDCPIKPAENPITGKDLLTSGAWTFERQHMAPVDAGSLTVSTDGTCGPEKGTKCASGCCSQYGNCGTSLEHCSGACQHAFGTGCTDADVAGSWQNAAKNGVTDEQAGGQYYYDPVNSLFWTWDTPDLITRKFNDIVRKYNLGGVMAWSLGEDSNDWTHVKRMADELTKTSSKPQSSYRPRPTSKTSKPKPEPEPTYKPQPPSKTYKPSLLTPTYPTADSYRNLPCNPTLESDPNLPYDVVWVDGTSDGPAGEYVTKPGSPDDYTIVWVDENGNPEETVSPKPREQSEAAAALAPAPPTPASPAPQYDDGSWSPGKYDRQEEGARVPGTTEQVAHYQDAPAPVSDYGQEEKEEPQYEQVCTLRRVKKRSARGKRAAARVM